MIPAKKANELAVKNNEEIPEWNRRMQTKTYERIARFVEKAIRHAAEDGKFSIFVSDNDISEKSGLKRKESFGMLDPIDIVWFRTLNYALKQNGYGTKADYIDHKCGWVISW